MGTTFSLGIEIISFNKRLIEAAVRKQVNVISIQKQLTLSAGVFKTISASIELETNTLFSQYEEMN